MTGYRVRVPNFVSGVMGLFLRNLLVGGSQNAHVRVELAAMASPPKQHNRQTLPHGAGSATHAAAVCFQRHIGQEELGVQGGCRRPTLGDRATQGTSAPLGGQRAEWWLGYFLRTTGAFRYLLKGNFVSFLP